MLGMMRKHAKSRFIKILLYAVALSFIIGFGAMGYVGKTSKGKNRGDTHWVAKVNDHLISYSEFKRALKSVREYYREQYGDKAEDYMKFFSLEEMTLQELIREKVLLDEATAKGIVVSDQELQGAIRKMGAFHGKNGRFEKQLYVKQLRRYGLAPLEFEESQRQGMASNNLKLLILDSVKVSDGELWGTFVMNNDRISLKYMKFNPDKLTEEPEVSDETVKDYFEKNKEEFKIPEKRQIQYIELDNSDFFDEVELNDDRIMDYYEQNKETKYKTDEQVKASHILILSSQEDSEENQKAAREKAEEVQKLASKPEADFAALAAQFSEDKGNKDKGGELGWFERKKMVPEFADAAFAMSEGEVSGVIKTMFGYHIIKVFGKREAGYTPLIEAAAEIRKTLKQSEAAKLALLKAESIFSELKPGSDLVEYAKENDLKADMPLAFEIRGKIAGVADAFKLSSEAFKLSQDEISNPISGRNKVYLIKLIKIEPEKEPGLDEVEEKVRQKVIDVQKSMMLAKIADQARLKLVAGEPPEKVATEFDVKIESTGSFTRNSYSIPKLGNPEGLSGAAFALTNEKPVANKVFESRKAQVVVWLEEKSSATKEEFEKQKETLRKQVMKDKEQELFEDFIKDAMNRAQIIKNDAIVSKFEKQSPLNMPMSF